MIGARIDLGMKKDAPLVIHTPFGIVVGQADDAMDSLPDSPPSKQTTKPRPPKKRNLRTHTQPKHKYNVTVVEQDDAAGPVKTPDHEMSDATLETGAGSTLPGAADNVEEAETDEPDEDPGEQPISCMLI